VSRPGWRAAGLGGRVSSALGALALLAAMAALTLEAGLRDTPPVSCGAILGYLALARLASRLWPSRPVSFLRFFILTQTSQSVSLILLAFVDGRLEFSTATGYYSLADGSVLVVLVGLTLSAAAVAGALLAGPRRRPAFGTWKEALLALPSRLFVVSCWMALAMLAGRVLLLFALEVIPVGLVYGLRLFVSYFLPAFAFAGAALRLGYRQAWPVLIFTGLVSSVVLLSGSRADAILPLALLGFGFVVARPMERQRLVRLGVLGAGAFILAMFVGDVVRGDLRGRTGDAALERAGELGAVVSEQSNVEAISTASLRRLISYAAHAVITRVPDEVPFEDGGLTNLPSEFASKVLPRFNLSGISESEKPRNWMLNELGFLVNWATSVELSLVADAWYRGGWAGLVVVGLVFGLLFQALENALYLGMQRRPALFMVQVFVVTTMIYVAGRDIVSAFRNTIFTVLAALLLFGVVSLGGRRRAGSRPGGPRASSAPLAPPGVRGRIQVTQP